MVWRTTYDSNTATASRRLAAFVERFEGGRASAVVRADGASAPSFGATDPNQRRVRAGVLRCRCVSTASPRSRTAAATREFSFDRVVERPRGSYRRGAGDRPLRARTSSSSSPANDAILQEIDDAWSVFRAAARPTYLSGDRASTTDRRSGSSGTTPDRRRRRFASTTSVVYDANERALRRSLQRDVPRARSREPARRTRCTTPSTSRRLRDVCPRGRPGERARARRSDRACSHPGPRSTWARGESCPPSIRSAAAAHRPQRHATGNMDFDLHTGEAGVLAVVCASAGDGTTPAGSNPGSSTTRSSRSSSTAIRSAPDQFKRGLQSPPEQSRSKSISRRDSRGRTYTHVSMPVFQYGEIFGTPPALVELVERHPRGGPVRTGHERRRLGADGREATRGAGVRRETTLPRAPNAEPRLERACVEALQGRVMLFGAFGGPGLTGCIASSVEPVGSPDGGGAP